MELWATFFPKGHAAAHKAFAVNYKTRRFRVMMTSYLTGVIRVIT